MSRRREAAELAIALSLSTQEVNRLTDIHSPPIRFNLSSGNTSTSQTQDSKDMELRPYLPPDGAGSTDVHTGIGYGYGGLPPSIGTVRPEDVMKAPSGSDSIQGSSESASRSGKGTSSAYNTSIQSFPSPSIHPPQAINATHTLSTPNQPASSGSSNPPIPTFPHRSSNIASSAWSSPLPPNGPSHVSSTELSSNRPLFSSTQGSGIPPITPDARPNVVKTYGKAGPSTSTSRNSPSPQKKLQRTNNIVMSSSPPPSEPPTNSHRDGRSTSPNKKRKNIVLSDDSDEEEEEEPVEDRTPLPAAITNVPTPKSRVEVVLPRSRPSSTNKPRENGDRHHSPDPLDSLNGSGTSPVKSINQPSSSAMTNGSSRRVSSRVADNKAKEAAEKEERRRKRREEKEKKKSEEEAKVNAGRARSPVKGKSPVKEKSVVSDRGSMVEPIEIEDSLEMENHDQDEIAPPPPEPVKAVPTPAETKGRKRKSDAVPINDDHDQDEDFDPSGKGKGKKPKKAKKEPVKKGKAAQKKVFEPEPEPEPEPEQPAEEEKMEEVVEEEKEEEPKEPTKSPTPPPPAKSVSPVRPPLRATSSNLSTPSASSITHRPSPGPVSKDGTPSAPGGIRWKAPRNDLNTVLAKFGGHKRSGLTKKLKIVPLHQKIGPPAKALPPVPKKPEKKKADSDEDDEEDEGNEDEFGNKKLKKGSLEWLMMED